MIRKMIKSAVVGMAMMSVVGSAQAAQIDINIYGASAQYLFWNDAADNFLIAQGCTGVAQAEYSDKKHGITRGTCGANTVYIRYTSKASYDGIRAVKCQDPEGLSAGCPSACYRRMADETATNFTTKVVSALSCEDVTIGASDVEADAFNQESHGALKGHLGGVWTDRFINGVDDSGLNSYRPLVVPFGFFKNNSVPYTNLTRLMAVHLFSGQVNNWQSFDMAQDNQDVVVCLRHAGSGTHATLDAAVMRGDLPLVIEENQVPFLGSVKWFNDGSSDMMKCIDQNAGAIGYADSDALKNPATYPNTSAVTYMGVSAVKANVVQGMYDFWSAQWLFESPTDANYGTTHSWVTALNTFASNPANLPASTQAFWATQSEMKVTKANSFAFPTRTVEP
ncbi:MAG: hypothetical protein ACOZF0_17545 [Thermodesulfobacteriota bacterium]